MVEFKNLENISDSSEEEIMRYAQDRVEKFHEHADDSPVQLQKIESQDNIDYSKDDSVSDKPKAAPFRYGCTCGMVFEAKDNDMHIANDAKKDAYSGKDAAEGYEQPKGYKG